MVRLGDIFEAQITGEWGNECAENETGTKVLRTTNFTPDGMINFDNVVLRRITESKVEKKRLRYGDIILEKSGGTEKTPVGRVVFCDELIEDDTYLCNNFTQAMRVNQKVGCSRYVFYFMWHLHYSGKTDLLQNKTTGIRNLQVNSYLNEEIPLPPLEEQRRIAALLDKVSDLIAKRRAQLDKLDLLIKARFVEMFGDPETNPMNWPIVGIGAITKTIDSGWSGNGTQREKKAGEIAVLKVSAVTKGYFIPEECKVLDDQENIKKYVFPQKDDLLFSRANTKEMVGATAIIREDYPELILPDKLWKIRFSDVTNVVYMKCILSSKAIRNKFSEASTGTSGSMYNVSMEKFKAIQIPMPEIGRQNQFASFAESVEKSKLTIQQSLDKLELLKKSLMQQYFG